MAIKPNKYGECGEKDNTRWWDYKLVQRVQKFVIKDPQNLTMGGWVRAVQHRSVTHQDQDWSLAPQNNKARPPRIKLHEDSRSFYHRHLYSYVYFCTIHNGHAGEIAQVPTSRWTDKIQYTHTPDINNNGIMSCFRKHIQFKNIILTYENSGK